MKNFKRLLCLALAVIMTFSCTHMIVFADESEGNVIEMTASKSKVTVADDAKVSLNIHANKELSFAGAQVKVLCDTNVFELELVEDAYGDMVPNVTANGKFARNAVEIEKHADGYMLLWYDIKQDRAGSDLFTIGFVVSSEAYDGEYTFSVDTEKTEITNFDKVVLDISQYVSETIEIDGKDPDPISGVEMSLKVDEYNYDATEKTPEILAPEGVTYTASGDLKATDAGDYKITVTGTGKYQGTKELTWKINKAPLTVTGVSAVGKSYDGNATIAIDKDAMTVTGWKKEADECEVTVPESVTVDAANAGTYDVEIPVTIDSKNYTVESIKTSVEISKAVVAQPARKNAPVAYTGEEQVIYVDGTGYTVKENGKATNAGTYTTKFGLVSDNYAWAAGAGADETWTIAKAAACNETAKAETLLYSNTETQTLKIDDLMPKANGAEITNVAVTGDEVVENVAVSADKKSASFNLKELEEKEYAFNVVITFNSNNYEDGSTITVPYSVIKKTLIPETDLVFPENAAPTAEFTGEAFDAAKIVAAEYKGDLKDYTISYKFYQDDAPVEAVEVGTYQLVATFEHETHYGTATVDFEITKKPVTVKSATVAAKTYGEPLETTVSDLVFDGVVSAYPIADSEYTATEAVFAKGDAGVQDVNFKLTLDTKNYKYESETATVKGTIAPAKVAVTVAEIADQVYTGSKIEPKPVVTYGETELKNVAYTYGENVDCDTYTVKVNATTGGNYTFDEVPVQFKIVEAEPVVTVADLTKDYDGIAVVLDDLNKSASFNGVAIEGTWNSDIATVAKADADTYTVKVSFDPENDNLKTVEKTIAVKINPIDAVVVNDIEEDGKTLADVLTVIDLAKDYVSVKWYDKDGNKIDATTEIEANTEYLYSVKSTSKNFNEVEMEEITPYEVSTGIESNINIKSGSTKHGSVSINPLDAEKGDKVVVTVKPKTGYEVDEVTVTTSKGKDVAVKSAGSNKYVFVMPAGQVTLEVTYKKADVVKFLDVADNAWYHDSVYAAVDMGLFTGVSDNYFQPDGSMTRAMLVTVLWRLEGSPAAGSADFADVANGSWYDKAVAWANEEGIVTGISDASFAPNAAITREQMATMLYRYAKYLGLNTAAKADLSDYADADKISAYAVDAMAWAVRAGLINGVTADTLAPAGTATRAQVATILVRFVEKFL